MEKALYQATALTFEELGFVFPDESSETSPVDANQSSLVSVCFHGPLSGTLFLQIENEVLSAIATNMLGEDGPVESEMQKDVLGELANVICGNALPEIGGRQEIFKLRAPDFDAIVDINREPSATARMRADEGRADVFLYLN